MNIKNTLLVWFVIGFQFLVAYGLYFQHNDWEVACDNTNFCRIAGYSSEENEGYNISLLISRKAGADTKIEAKIQIGDFWDEENKIREGLPSKFEIQMFINNKSYGTISIKEDDLIGVLSQKQIQSLLTLLKEDINIVFKYKNYTGHLSDKGASAVLLKADTFQKYIGTKGAFYKKGFKSEKSVLMPKLPPTIYVKPTFNAKEVTMDLKYRKMIEGILLLDKDECFDMDEEGNKYEFYNLSSTKLVVSKVCWRAAYNVGIAYWVINKKPPFDPILITTEGTDYYMDKNNIAYITERQKGRGIGDCWYYKDYVWNGKNFELSLESTTGLCRAIAAGGAWNLPTFISEVKIKP